jgi:hypothetical protein
MDRAPAPIHRTISYALRIAREREESETLLAEEESQQVDPSGCVISPQSVAFNPHADLPVYKNIHRYAAGSQRSTSQVLSRRGLGLHRCVGLHYDSRLHVPVDVPINIISLVCDGQH